jgi:6-phosphofructokinase 1
MITQENTAVVNLGPRRVESPLKLASHRGKGVGVFVPDEARILYQVEFGTEEGPESTVRFEKAGPREQIFFNPAKAKAAIVTCGGLCPGLNNVIRSATLELWHNYGVKNVLGIRYGYAGLNPASGLPPMILTPQVVDRVHEEGGTFLGTSRGPQDPDVMLDFLMKENVNILLCIGGDGTLHGAGAIADEARKRKLPISVIGIPKTIDNDVMYVTRTFGLVTATEKAREVINCAHNEATSALNGVGLVKVMGRAAGFIAAAATLASQEVNFCLIPEVPFILDGEKGFLQALRQRLERRQHAVVVVAEGAGQDLLKDLPAGKDASGNKRLADIGVYLKEQIVAYFKDIHMPADVKYIDPSYVIRSVPANCDDSLLCDQLARNAVHAAMAGKTGALMGFWNGAFTHVPIALGVSEKKHVDTDGPLWRSVLAATGQPGSWT